MDLKTGEGEGQGGDNHGEVRGKNVPGEDLESTSFTEVDLDDEFRESFNISSSDCERHFVCSSPAVDCSDQAEGQLGGNSLKNDGNLREKNLLKITGGNLRKFTLFSNNE